MNRRRVVISGVGPVSAAGVGRGALSDAVAAGRSGVGPLSRFDSGRYGSRLAAEVRGFDVADYLESEKTYLDPASEFAFAAMALALEDAALDMAAVDRARAGLLMGTAGGAVETMRLFFRDFVDKGPRFVKPVLFPHTYANAPISLLAIEYGLTGYHMNFSSGWTASSDAILEGFDRVRQGREDLAFAGGCEALSEPVFEGYARLGWLSPDGGGEERCAPFDRGRNGFVLGEGGAVLVLESLDRARARGAEVRGEILGGAAGGDSAAAGGRPGPGLRRCMERALADAGCAAGDIDGVFASANGSRATDRGELDALAALFRGRETPVVVTSVKPLLGEALGADGALQAAAALAAMERGAVPAMCGVRDPEPAPGLRLAAEGGPGLPVRTALLNAIDPGGSIVSLVLRAEGSAA